MAKCIRNISNSESGATPRLVQMPRTLISTSFAMYLKGEYWCIFSFRTLHNAEESVKIKLETDTKKYKKIYLTGS